jgi:putative transposase
MLRGLEKGESDKNISMSVYNISIESDEHFPRCLVYLDMNMVRAGVVKHPAEWVHGGYREIQQQLRQWLIEELTINNSVRDKTWSESLALWSEDLVEKIKTLPNTKATNREVTEMADKHALREQSARYNSDFGTKNTGLRLNNRHFRDDLQLKSMSYPDPTRR